MRKDVNVTEYFYDALIQTAHTTLKIICYSISYEYKHMKISRSCFSTPLKSDSNN